MEGASTRWNCVARSAGAATTSIFSPRPEHRQKFQCPATTGLVKVSPSIVCGDARDLLNGRPSEDSVDWRARCHRISWSNVSTPSAELGSGQRIPWVCPQCWRSIHPHDPSHVCATDWIASPSFGRSTAGAVVSCGGATPSMLPRDISCRPRCRPLSRS